MSKTRQAFKKILAHALSGEGAHVLCAEAVAGLDWKAAGVRRAGSPHTVFQLLNHMNYWQDWVLKWAKGKKPAIPKHASGGWPGRTRPVSRQDWDRAVGRFRKGLAGLIRLSQEADPLSERAGKSHVEMLQEIASHNSFHLGQVVLLRRMLDRWPPPSGGLTW